MPEYTIGGISVHFPFEPYDVQTAYMEKVINCLRNGTNGVLESPTGTGKTLSLLCSSLAWILSRKSDFQTQMQMQKIRPTPTDKSTAGELNVLDDATKVNNWGIPKIIYASRTHSQLTQAMQELKRTAYSFMRAVVLGSRDQLCIHPEVMREIGNSNKIQMCKMRVDTHTCTFHARVESRKDHPDFQGPTIMDIEDLVKVGQKLKMCPYYSSKELVPNADITFMPYNYLLDPKARKANKVELNNTIVILDEAHNIEKICEESASVQIKSSEIAVAIDDVTHIMKSFTSTDSQDFSGDEPKDFTLEDLASIKAMLLDLEKAIDDIVVENKDEGATYQPAYMFEILEKANFTAKNSMIILHLLDKLLQYLAVQSQNSSLRKGGSFQTLSDFLAVVFLNKEELVAKVLKSFKMHVQIEEIKQRHINTNKDGWLSKQSNSTTSTNNAKIINYWCFNPGFGMEQLLNKNIRSVILTSGTLAPLKPLIAELAIPVAEQLENPHIVNTSQVYVKIIGAGPDREQLISNYANRDNPKYISSLGQTILNVARIIPDGLLVFFPSYPVMNQCANAWQASGLWRDISQYKPIFIEPRNKEDFTNAMESFYQSIRDGRGACFMAVCRGKVSEGLDFADRNGRAVIITGLPFPPMKDPKVILKKRYLEDNRTKENELLTGQAWYSLEATRAVNQAIGRVIRHRNDYGAILLCDVRFQQISQVQQLSKWIRGHLGQSPKSAPFGSIVRELREFFKNAENKMPKPKERSIDTLVEETCEEAGIVRSKFFSDPKTILSEKLNQQKMRIEKTNSIESWTPNDYKVAAGQSSITKIPSALDFMSRLDTNTTAIDFNSVNIKHSDSAKGLVKIHKRDRSSPTSSLDVNSGNCSSVTVTADSSKKKRYKLVDNSRFTLSQPTETVTSSVAASSQQLNDSIPEQEAPANRLEFLKVLRSSLSATEFSEFTTALIAYREKDAFDALMEILLKALGKRELHYMLRGMRRFLKAEHKALFDKRITHLQ